MCGAYVGRVLCSSRTAVEAAHVHLKATSLGHVPSPDALPEQNIEQRYPNVVMKRRQGTWEMQPRCRRLLSQGAALAIPGSYFTAWDAAMAMAKCAPCTISVLDTHSGWLAQV